MKDRSRKAFRLAKDRQDKKEEEDKAKSDELAQAFLAGIETDNEVPNPNDAAFAQRAADLQDDDFMDVPGAGSTVGSKEDW